MKRNTNTQTLKQAIDRLLKAYGLGDKMAEYDIIEAWEEIMGKTIAKRTKNIYIKNSVLYIEIESSTLRNELNMAKTKIIELINEKAGKELVNNLVIK
jgi:predicted nucleic acid-binding Zn ribbon protein